MLFTEIIRFLSSDKISITAIALDPDLRRIVTLSQDNMIKVWKILDLYLWEDKLRGKIEEQDYQREFHEYKPMYIINGLYFDGCVNVLRFSKCKHIIKLEEAQKTKSASKTRSIEVKSTLNPGKKVKISIVQSDNKKHMEEENNHSDFLIAIGSDHGVVSFFRNTSPNEQWLKFHEFRIGTSIPILDLAWNANDGVIALATFSLEVKIYKLQLSSTFGHSLVKTIKSQGGQIHQVLWHHDDLNTFAVFQKERIEVWNMESEVPVSISIINSSEVKNKQSLYKEKEELKSPEISGLEEDEEDMINFTCGFKLQTSWVRDRGNLIVWGDKGSPKKATTTLRKTKNSLKSKEPFEGFTHVNLEGLICIKVSPGIYIKQKKAKPHYVGLAYDRKKLEFFLMRDGGNNTTEISDVTVSVSIRNINKNFIDFIWLDSYRILGLDETGQIHMIRLAEADLGFLYS